MFAYTQSEVASRNFPAERFRPSTSASGIIDTETALVPEPLTWDLMLWLSYAKDPLVLTRIENNQKTRQPLVAHRLGGNLVGSIVLFSHLQVGLDLPMALYQTASDKVNDVIDGAKNIKTVGLGNLRVAPKLQILNEKSHIISLALIASTLVPTKTASAYFGDAKVGFVPELAISRRIDAYTLALNVNYLSRTKQKIANLVVEDELGYHAAISYILDRDAANPVTVAASIFGSTSAKRPYVRSNQTANEILFGITYGILPNFDFTAAGGFGLSKGFGTPVYRGLVGLRLRTEREAEPEIVPPLPPPPTKDSDGDGLLDPDDKCPNKAEDKDDFEDNDGCPDLDNDKDNILDVDDQCPNESENLNQWQDEDGCLDEIPDKDGDGILDNVDQCVDAPEDKDGFQDEDGCPDSDNDADTVPDKLDNCPNEPGSVAFQGCKAKQWVKLEGDKIEIKKKIFFESGSGKIQSRSFELIDNIAKVLLDHPEIELVRIEGHTDNKGPAKHNKKLSQSRADAVLSYLIKKGIPSKRLMAVGYGSERPIVPNKTAKNRATNRRVEFVIVSKE
ncbi:MAG: OmpA family protein [Deltaproteobacteria bacterium]|nr:OmpA family protein [Deltaproteobacteria bacterium]